MQNSYFYAILVLTAENQLLDKTVNPQTPSHNLTKNMKVVKSQSFQKFLPIILISASIPKLVDEPKKAV
jgi:hypothetical protein